MNTHEYIGRDVGFRIMGDSLGETTLAARSLMEQDGALVVAYGSASPLEIDPRRPTAGSSSWAPPRRAPATPSARPATPGARPLPREPLFALPRGRAGFVHYNEGPARRTASRCASSATAYYCIAGNSICAFVEGNSSRHGRRFQERDFTYARGDAASGTLRALRRAHASLDPPHHARALRWPPSGMYVR